MRWWKHGTMGQKLAGMLFRWITFTDPWTIAHSTLRRMRNSSHARVVSWRNPRNVSRISKTISTLNSSMNPCSRVWRRRRNDQFHFDLRRCPSTWTHLHFSPPINHFRVYSNLKCSCCQVRRISFRCQFSISTSRREKFSSNRSCSSFTTLKPPPTFLMVKEHGCSDFSFKWHMASLNFSSTLLILGNWSLLSKFSRQKYYKLNRPFSMRTLATCSRTSSRVMSLNCVQKNLPALTRNKPRSRQPWKVKVIAIWANCYQSPPLKQNRMCTRCQRYVILVRGGWISTPMLIKHFECSMGPKVFTFSFAFSTRSTRD